MSEEETNTLVVFVTYPHKDSLSEYMRDFVDEALIDFFDHSPELGEVSGGGTYMSEEKSFSCTDVDLERPFEDTYRALVDHLKALKMPDSTVLRSPFGITPLYDIVLPNTKSE